MSLQTKEPQLLGAGKKMERESRSERVEDLHGERYSDVGCDRNEKIIDGGIDHLMILAQSAELVEADHHFCSLDENNQSCEGNNTARQRGRTRLTQLRHYARTKHAHLAAGLLIKSSTDKVDFPKLEDQHYEAQRGKERVFQIDGQKLHRRKHLHDPILKSQQEVNSEERREPPWTYTSYFHWYVSDRAQVLRESQRIARQERMQRRQKEKSQETLPTEVEIQTVYAEKKRLRPIAPRLVCNKDNIIAHQMEQQTALELSKGFQGERLVANGHAEHVRVDKQSRYKKQHIPQLGEQLVNVERASKNSHNGLNSSMESGQDTYIEQEQKPLRVKGAIRLTQLRCQARAKYLAEKGKGLLKCNGRTKLVR